MVGIDREAAFGRTTKRKNETKQKRKLRKYVSRMLCILINGSQIHIHPFFIWTNQTISPIAKKGTVFQIGPRGGYTHTGACLLWDRIWFSNPNRSISYSWPTVRWKLITSQKWYFKQASYNKDCRKGLIHKKLKRNSQRQYTIKRNNMAPNSQDDDCSFARGCFARWNPQWDYFPIV